MDELTTVDLRVMDQRIAEQLGFRLIPVEKGSGRRKDHPSYPPERLAMTETAYMIEAPEGFEARLENYSHPSEADAWQTIHNVFPFSTDLNAAMLLCRNISFFITSNGGTTMYPDNPAVWVGNGDPVMAASDAPEDIAKAICEAWEAYKDNTANLATGNE